MTVSITCPICAREDVALHGRKDAHGSTWNIHRCTTCGHGFVSNRPTMDDLRAVYTGEDHHPLGSFTPEAWRLKKDCAQMAAKIARLTTNRGCAMDIGSGDGGFAWHLRQRGFHPLLLIDLDPRAAEAVTHIDDARFRLCAFEDITAADGPFDAIVMSQILEHALDPMDWLQRSRDLLNPGGVLAIALPNFGGVYRLLGARDPMLIPPVHLNFFSPRSLQRALEQSGFRTLSAASNSRVRTAAVDHPLSAKRIALGHTWNLLTRPLNLTTRGIILTMYATPA